jgi:hypothetical protein
MPLSLGSEAVRRSFLPARLGTTSERLTTIQPASAISLRTPTARMPTGPDPTTFSATNSTCSPRLKRAEFGTALSAYSGKPVNVTTGNDENHDGLALDRAADVPRKAMHGPSFIGFDVNLSHDFLLTKDGAKGPVPSLGLNSSIYSITQTTRPTLASSDLPFRSRGRSRVPTQNAVAGRGPILVSGKPIRSKGQRLRCILRKLLSRLALRRSLSSFLMRASFILGEQKASRRTAL